MNIFFYPANMTRSFGDFHVRTVRDTILSEPWLHAKIFRDICSLFFTTIGWATYYVW